MTHHIEHGGSYLFWVGLVHVIRQCVVKCNNLTLGVRRKADRRIDSSLEDLYFPVWISSRTEKFLQLFIFGK